MNRKQRIVAYVAAGLVSGLLLAGLSLYMLSRTEFGMERVRRYAVKWLDDRVDGTVHVGAIGGRSLLGGVTLKDFYIIDKLGRPFMRMDSVRLAYNWRTLIAGEIVISRAVLYDPEIYFEQLPGDSIWNYQHVFPSRGPPGAPVRRRLIMINGLRIVNGTAVVRVPYETPQEARRTAADERREVIDSVPGGLAKVLRFDSISSLLSRVVWESPIEPGKLLDIRSLSGRGFVWREPMHVTALRGTVTLRDTIVAFDIPEVRFPSSRASMVGRVIMEEGSNFFDVRVDSRSFAFRDLQWLYQRLPDDGGGSGVLLIQSQRPRGILWLATNTRIAAPGTRVAGNFGVVTGADSLYFTDVNLRASPLNLELVQTMLPSKLPIEGLLVGTVEVKGGLSSLITRGDVRLANSNGTSGVKWRGTLDVERGLGARTFRADLQALDLGLVSALLPELKLRGQVTGHVEASGNLASSVKFAADLQHYLSGYTSSIEGSGTYTGGATPGLDVELNARPLALDEIAQAYPALRRLQGEARGPIRLTGTLDDLGLRADLQTLGGRVELDGRLTNTDGLPHYSGDAKLHSFRLDRLISELPETSLNGTAAFNVTGSGTENTRGRVTAALASGSVRNIAFADARAALSIQDGLARVDTLLARTALGDVRASGTFGIAEGRSGQLTFEVHSDSLRPLSDETSEPAATAGRVQGTGTVSGSVHGFDLTANLGVDGFRYGSITSDRVRLVVGGKQVASDSARFDISGRADSLFALGERVDTATASLTYSSGRGDVRVEAGSHKGLAYLFDAGLERAGQRWSFSVRDLQVGETESPWKLTAAANLQMDDHGLVAEPLELKRADGSRIRAAGTIAWHGVSHAPEAGQTSDFRLDFAGVPFAEFALVTGGPAQVEGTMEGHVRVTGSAPAPVLDGDATVTGFAVRDATLDHLNGSFTYASRRLNARVDAERAGRRVFFADGLIPIDLAFMPVKQRRLPEPLRFAMQADSLPAIFMTALIGGFEAVQGRVDGNLVATGTTQHPQLAGSLTLRDGGALWDATGVRYRDVTGTLHLEQNRAATLNANLKANGGSAQIGGTLDFTRLTNPGFALEMRADNFLAAHRRDMEFTASGTVKLGGQYRQPEVSGDLRVDRGELFLDELYRRYQIVELDNPLLYDVVDTSIVSLATIVRTQNPFVKNLVVHDLNVSVGRESWLRSRDLNVEVSGELTVAFLLSNSAPNGQRTADDLRMIGTLRALRGTYQLVAPGIARRFAINEGTIEFPGTPGVDPNLGFNAVYRAPRTGGQDPIDIIAVVGGTLRTPHVRLTSDEDQQISESDLASYLFFGAPTYALSSAQSAAVTQATTGLLKSSGFGYLAGGLQNVAQSYGLLDYVGLTAAEATSPGLQTERGIASLFAGTRLELGRYVGEEGQVYIAYSQRLSSTGYRAPGVRVEWRFIPRLTGELFWEDRFARNPDFGIEQSNLKRVLGIFVFREWSY